MEEQNDLGWTYSSSEEYWNNDTGFASREDALAEAKGTLDVEVGQRIYTARAVPVKPLAVAEHVVDAERIIDDMQGYLYDELGDEINTEIETTVEQRHLLEAGIVAVIETWLLQQKVLPESYLIEDMRYVTVTVVTKEGIETDE